jgi:multisubunit Na+/H+ antiporter MnhG subunit
MNGKLSNISKWVFGALALVTVVLGVIFYLDLHNEARTNMILNWGYILIILGIVMIVCSAIVAAFVKGVNLKTILIVIGAFVVIGLVAYLMSKGSFGVEYPSADHVYSGTTHGLVEWGLNFFYITLGVSVLCILYSVIRSGK